MIENPLPSLTLADSIDDDSIDTIVVGLSCEATMSPSLARLDSETDRWITGLIDRDQIRGKKGEMTLLASPKQNGPTMILVVGLGEAPELSREDAFNLSSAAIRKLSDRPRPKVLICLAECCQETDTDAVVAGAVNGCQGQAIYKTDSDTKLPEEVAFLSVDSKSLSHGEVIGTSINQVKFLINGPAADIYPASFAQHATDIAADCGLEIEVWDEKRLESEQCRSILAVGQGSPRAPRLVILRHQGGGDEAPIALVGKGVTFDSGGLSMKPSAGMVNMKCDMGGAATVLGVMRAIAKLGIPKNVIGFCGLAENMVSGDSYKLGDVIQTRNGKTVEILNTDAEGRVVLADTLDVAIQHNPQALVDLATLTGACVVALGNDVSGLMANDDELCQTLISHAQSEGELVWQLPMFKLYDEQIKSKVADIRNVGEGRWGGAITAAKFLEQFVGDVPWVHIDIAGTAFSESAKPHRDAGGTGVMVRTLLRWIESEAS